MIKKNKVINLIKNGKLVFEEKILPSLDKKKIRIKIKAIGVCASDIPRAFQNGAYNYPLVMGHEITGEIYESNFAKFKKNQKVAIFPLIPCKKCFYCKSKNFNHCNSYGYYGSRENGGYANFIDVYPWNILKIDKKIKFLDSFALEPSAVALNTINTIFKNKPKKNSKLLILGSGFIGLLIINLINIKFKHLNVTVVDRNDHKLKLVPKRYNKINIKKIKNLKELSNSFDHIIETTGNSRLISNILSLSKHKGTIIFMGNISNGVSFKKKEVNFILRKELKLLGIWNSNYKNPNQDDWKEVLQFFKKGFRPSKFVSHKIKLTNIPYFIRKVYLSRKKLIKFKFLKIVALND